MAGTWRRDTSFVTATPSTVTSSSAAFGRWAFGIGQPRRDRCGRTDIVKGRSVRSGGNVLTTLSCSASGISAICCGLTRPTITRLARTFRSTRTRRRRERYMPLVAFCLRHFLADSIMCMYVFDFRQAQLVQDLYTASKDNQAFLHARLGLGHDQLQPFKASISNWICPDVMKNQPISISKAKKAIADYKKAIGRPDGMAELSIFYCEEAFGFLESCSMEDESYFVALIRMYERSLEFVLSLPPAERATFLERLDKLRSRGRHVGWGVQDELNRLWYAAALDELLWMTASSASSAN